MVGDTDSRAAVLNRLRRAQGQLAGVQVDAIMSREIISCDPRDSILDVVLKLEQHDISALPVLGTDGKLLGAITADLLATRTLYRLLLGEEQGG